MRISWMFIFFLVCKLCHTAQPQSDAKCQYIILKRVSANGNVTVPCPHTPSEEDEIMFYLLKDEEVIHNYTCKQANNCTGSINLGVELDKNNSSWFFTLRGGPKISGLYRCNSTKTYPPPLEKRQGAPVLVKEFPHVPGRPTTNLPDVSATIPPQFLQIPWIWIAVIALVSIYAITATIIALINWQKLKKTESQSDYMNTKPIAPRDRRKKRGVQNIPKHF
uniref:CD28 molecule n=1 Tax=Amphilophus citrinellus TaxID=61819 RepID=A0A3Q0QPF6_AMPCI